MQTYRETQNIMIRKICEDVDDHRDIIKTSWVENGGPNIVGKLIVKICITPF